MMNAEEYSISTVQVQYKYSSSTVQVQIIFDGNETGPKTPNESPLPIIKVCRAHNRCFS